MVRIGIVGVCAAGKSTLAATLHARGYDARQISQEHSYVPDLWRRFSKADLLIYLDAGLQTIRDRRSDPEWPAEILELEAGRLAHARQHCHLYICTDTLRPEDVLFQTLKWLAERGLPPGVPPVPRSD